jgi:hypothetical protein
MGLVVHKKLYACKEQYEEKGCFVIGLAIQFLSCRRHLQLIVFICCEL